MAEGDIMARVAKGKEMVDLARQAIIDAGTVTQLRQAQAVVLPLDCGLDIKTTARMIGLSVSQTSHLRNAFLHGTISGKHNPPRGGRHHALFTKRQEAELLEPFMNAARTGCKALVVSEVKQALEAELGRPMALSTVYGLLRRHGWRPKIISH